MIKSNPGAALLKESGIAFEVKNNGAHLIVEGNSGFIDYWPGTGRWKTRGNQQTDPIQGFGAHNLIAYIEKGRISK